MTNKEIKSLVDKYWKPEEYIFPNTFEHRYDPDSSVILYSLIREYKPRQCLEIGTWMGGSSHVIMSALKKNDLSFQYVASELEDDLREATYNHVKQVCGDGPRMIGDITKNLERIPQKIDFLMIDTNHDLETTKWIVNNIFPHVQKGALLSIHDWAVEEKDGQLISKEGAWAETEYYVDLIKGNNWPFKKIYWTYKNPSWEGMSELWESSFWEKV